MRRTYVSEDEACTYRDALSEVEFLTAESDIEAIEVMRRILLVRFSLEDLGFSRIVVVQLSEQRHLLGIVVDHIITDMISWDGLLSDFAEFYERALASDAGEITERSTYRSFASLQRREFSGAWGEERRRFWHFYTEEFGTYPPRFSIGRDCKGTYSPKFVDYELSMGVVSKVREFAGRAKATPFAVVASSVLAGMREVTGDPTVGIVSPHHGRVLPGTSLTIGQFILDSPLHLRGGTRRPLEVVREVFLRSLDVFEYGLPLHVAGNYWNENLMPIDRKPGIFMVMNSGLPSFEATLLAGTVAGYVVLEVPGETRMWAETVILNWQLQETGSRLFAYYDENFFPSAAVERLIETAERFVLSGDN
jgi:hypothetical protein